MNQEDTVVIGLEQEDSWKDLLERLQMEEIEIVELAGPYPHPEMRQKTKAENGDKNARRLATWGVTGGTIGFLSVLAWLYMSQAVSDPLVAQGRISGWESLPGYVPGLFEGTLLGAGLALALGFVIEGGLLRTGGEPSGNKYEWKIEIYRQDREKVETYLKTMGVCYEAFDVKPLTGENGNGWWRMAIAGSVLVVAGVCGWVVTNELEMRGPVGHVFGNMVTKVQQDDLRRHGLGGAESPGVTPPQTVGYNDLKQSRAATAYLATGKRAGGYGNTVPEILSRQQSIRNLTLAGKNIYKKHCACCHGVEGNGKGTVAQYLGYPQIPSVEEPKFTSYPLGRLYASTAWGQGNMPAFREVMPSERVWKAVLWMRQLATERNKKGGRHGQ